MKSFADDIGFWLYNIFYTTGLAVDELVGIFLIFIAFPMMFGFCLFATFDEFSIDLAHAGLLFLRNIFHQ